MAETEDAAESASGYHDPEKGFLVVGLGASAGGIPALSAFFQNVPPDSGMAYVVILHLSPDHESHLARVLQTTARIPVSQVTERVKVRPNHVYVVTPDKHLTLVDGSIVVLPNVSIEERRAPVDIFFRTLADSLGSRAVCVVLSGTGGNGSAGLKRVKERGGVAFVQTPREAEFDEMPRHAIATHLVDNVLDVVDIPAAILAYKERLSTVRIAIEVEDRPAAQMEALRDIFTHLRVRTGHDFTNYKRPTLLRRIERRINVRNCPDLPAYAALLRDSADECQALLKDLLISVTSFFRDGKAWDVIEQDVIPRLFQGKSSQDTVRIWAVGCATGEEAYTLAMLCAEAAFGAIDAPKVQIFATDIDEQAVKQAREAVYTLNDAADVSPNRLGRFFAQDAGGYRVRREVREMVLFAAHNVLKDPPFSHVDLITCRNLLIYLNAAAQERVLSTLHFALNPGGFLFLGNSESVEGTADLFATFNNEAHLFQSRQTGARPYPVPELSTNFRIDGGVATIMPSRNDTRRLERIGYGELHQQLLEQYAPPSIVVNEDYDIVHLSPRAGRYLEMGGGAPSMNVLKLVRDDLRLELRTALFQAAQRQSAVDVRNLRVRTEEREEVVDLHVRPVTHREDPARGFILVVFEPASGAPPDAAVYASDQPLSRQLEEELARVKTQLRSSTEQHEVQAEELKASNEELQAMNEELRSSAEELETSKEELQSMNEELTTVNQELKVKVEEVGHTTNDLQNLINSTNIGTIFLDRGLRVKLFTPAVRDLFNLIPADVGRPLSDITSRIRYEGLLDDAAAVLHTLQEIEREVSAADNRVYIMRILPYRTAEDRIVGIVITFIEISRRKQAEERLRASEADFRATFEVSSVGKLIADPRSRRILRANAAMAALLGYDEDELRQRSYLDVVHADDVTAARSALDGLVKGEAPEVRSDQRFVRRDKSVVWGDVAINLVRDEEGRPARIVVVVLDVTARKLAQDALAHAREELEERVRERTSELAEAIESLQRQNHQRDLAEQARLVLARQLANAQESERQRISRELHDQLGQQVTAILLKLNLLRNKKVPADLSSGVKELEQITRNLDSQLDFLVWELRPTVLDDLGLADAVADYVAGWSKRYGGHADIDLHGMGKKRIERELETVIYRSLQEALTNVAKHAKAKHVKVSLRQSGKIVALEVRDDGVGFDPKRKTQGLGIVGMRERAATVGGTLELETAPGKGTLLRVKVGGTKL